jgi:NAD(P)H-dependent FMN reductase
MVRIGIVVGTTRPGRKAVEVAEWALARAVEREDATFELVDIADYELPLLDEEAPPFFGRYAHLHTQDWAARIASFDGFVFVTPEYNRSIPGSLKNAVDFLFAEWNDKAAGFISYGLLGGVRAVEQLRLVLGELKVGAVRASVALRLSTDFEDTATFRPGDGQEKALDAMLDELVDWAEALKSLRRSRAPYRADEGVSDGDGTRVLILGSSKEVQRELKAGLEKLGLGLVIETSIDVEDADLRFDALDYDVIVFGRGIVGPLSHRLRREFGDRNHAAVLLDAWSPVAVRQIATAAKSTMVARDEAVSMTSRPSIASASRS